MHFFIYNDEFYQCTKGEDGGDDEGISCLMLHVGDGCSFWFLPAGTVTI